ncbi:TIGR03619 family F420-dependent LLM class oxidoreductase [Oceanicoccus sp. KOV_DT_Chl]|uniref:TIGR03619 family F420-dependent LLM class oxidoreductase n=1 Tax=Oceanicoccus sp. KOV_DT_Chl TaxID=1904639 RepID=UPI000C7E1A21|nr:TIGR03619 family F420-dependent LLM class oxidoreductase [Oceanicoccus sp. KOV_DT_Chl]
MKFWQSLAFVEMDQMVELACFCETLGFHGVSYGDHLVTTKEQVDEYLYRQSGNIFWNPETHWPDPWVITAALAQATTRLHFLTTVFILPLRDPISVAKAISTAAFMSNDRVTLGAGVGWQKAEFEMVGQNFHTRGKRADEMLQIIPALMRGEITEYHGQFYDIPAVKMAPATNQPVPIMVGGYAPAAMRRAATVNGWMATSHDEQEIYPLLDTLNEIRQQQGNADKPFDIWTGVKNPGDGTHERLKAAGVTMVNGTNFLDENGQATLSSIDDKKRRLEQFANQFLK